MRRGDPLQLSFKQLFGTSLDEFEAWFVSQPEDYWSFHWKKRCEEAERTEKRLRKKDEIRTRRWQEAMSRACTFVRKSNWSKAVKRRLRQDENFKNPFNRQSFGTFFESEED